MNNLLESHAPMKETYIRHNQAPFMNKSVRKRLLWFGPNFLMSLEKKIHLSMN